MKINSRVFCAIFMLTFCLPVILFAQEVMTQEDKAKFGRAQSLNNLKKYDESAPLLTELHSAFPQDKNISFELAKALGYGKRYDQAKPIIDKLIADHPDDAPLKYTCATIFESNQKFSEAYRLYAELLKNDPENRDLKLKMADLSIWMKDYPTAIIYYKELGVSADSDKDSFRNLGDAYAATARFNEASEVYNELLKRYPDDIAVRTGYIESLFSSGRADDAAEEVKALFKEKPGDTKLMIRLAEVLAVNSRYDEAIDICRTILSADPKDLSARLWLARVLSWKGRYNEAIDEYGKMIKEHPDMALPRREKARVLGWMRKYERSIEEYAAIQRDVKPPDEPSRLEMTAKDDYYRRFDARGIRDYNKWLKDEPEDLEALFDLGQIYSRQMQWRNAEKVYNKILDIMPSHFRAKEALGKVKLYSRSIEADIGFESYQAASTSRDVDEAYWDIYSFARAPIREDLYLSVREDTYIHSFSTASLESFVRQRMGTGLEYSGRPFFWASAYYYYSMYTAHFKNSNNFTGELNAKPTDFLLASFSYKKEDVLDNPQTFAHNLKRDDYKTRLTLDPNRRLSLGADYTYSYFSDTNNKFIYGADVKTQVLYEPRSLVLSYRYEEYGFGTPSSYYFSPGSFHYNTLAVEFRHFLNKEELFWGSNNTYYTVKYAVNFDVHDQVGNLICFDFHRDWTDRISTHIEWRKKIYNNRDTYGEEDLMAYGKVIF